MTRAMPPTSTGSNPMARNAPAIAAASSRKSSDPAMSPPGGVDAGQRSLEGPEARHVCRASQVPEQGGVPQVGGDAPRRQERGRSCLAPEGRDPLPFAGGEPLRTCAPSAAAECLGDLAKVHGQLYLAPSSRSTAGQGS